MLVREGEGSGMWLESREEEPLDKVSYEAFIKVSYEAFVKATYEAPPNVLHDGLR